SFSHLPRQTRRKSEPPVTTSRQDRYNSVKEAVSRAFASGACGLLELRGRDSNPDFPVQSRASFPWTTPQSGAESSRRDVGVTRCEEPETPRYEHPRRRRGAPPARSFAQGGRGDPRDQFADGLVPRARARRRRRGEIRAAL